ncbi:MAG: ribonuclease H-like domain-containing protein [Anaerolineales bacterium]|nr:ribonuclease H-like domain-containing protein [Anaerolineales bacterium]
MPARSLAEKLKSLGVKFGTSDLLPPQPKPKTSVPIEEVVDGRYIATPQGDTFVYENHYPLDYHHGIVPLCPPAPLHTLAQWANDMRLANLPLEAFAFLDTETSGLAGGTGTYAFMVGVGRFEGETFRLVQFFMRDPSEEAALLEALADFLAPCKALVTFNGKAFDAPLLAARYTLHATPSPFADFAHLDLLPLARRRWRDRLPSRALKYLEENVLNASRTVEEVPGYEIPYLYFDYLRSGDATPLKGVFYHNAMDVVALAAMLNHTSHMLADPLHESIEHGLDRIALAKLFEDLGKWDEAARLYERGLEQQLPETDFWQAVKRLSLLQRRRGDLSEAARLWEKAAAEGHVYAHIELAKYYEHRLRDHAAALEWTRKAMERVGELDIPRYEYDHWIAELEYRRKRLEGKAGK